MDRYAVNGSKDIGFWFFHEAVGPVDGGSFTGFHCAPHQTTNGCLNYPHGDILILTTFSAGGGTTTARAYEWVIAVTSVRPPACGRTVPTPAPLWRLTSVGRPPSPARRATPS
ncbi:MAG: hypothetical protein E6G39_01245 [Actinobacteria bacterium]|nr:MAG: hypothetical protein E6G39_01245 [Actinomycetota bacterium]